MGSRGSLPGAAGPSLRRGYPSEKLWDEGSNFVLRRHLNLQEIQR